MSTREDDGPSVLVVEDSRVLRRTLCRALRRTGYTVTETEDVQSATALMAERRFDLLATDIRLPGGSGMSLLRRAQSAKPEVPVVLMTGAPELDTAIEAVELGASSYLAKPFSPRDFLDVVARTIAKGESAKRSAADARLEFAFDRALEELYLAYQPIVWAADGRAVAHEALMRSCAPSLTRPDEILRAADRLGRLPDVGRRVRSLAAEALRESRPSHRLFVNVHPADLSDDELFCPRAPLSAHANRVTLEITERETLSEIAGADERVRALRDLGYRIAVDDLGAGYSSLNYLARLEPDIIKLDMDLVRGIDVDDLKSRLVRMLIELCRGMGSQVVGEGVETGGEHRRLAELRCDMLQGYRFGRPAPTMAAAIEHAPNPRLGR